MDYGGSGPDRVCAADLNCGRFRASGSGEVHRETLEIGERAVAEGSFVSGPQDHPGRLARLESQDRRR
jgi:hypothetical protein